MWRQPKMQTFIFRANFSRLSVYKQPSRVISVATDVNDTTTLKPWTQIPGPNSYPFIGPLLSFLPGGHLYNIEVDLVKTLHDSYGPIVRIDKMLNKKPMIFIYDAESVAQIYRGEAIMPIRPGLDSLGYYRQKIKNVTPNSPMGLLGIHGEKWQDFRSTISPVLLQPKTIRLYSSVIDEVALDMVKRLKALRDDKHMIPNLDKEMNLWALESVGVIALGCRIKCFDDHLNKDSPVQQLIEVVTNIMNVIYELDLIKPNIWQYYPTKTYKEALEYYNKQEILARHFIELAIKEFQSNPKPDDQKGVLEKLLEINKEVGIIMASDMLLAGIDSASHSVLGALYLLATNPDKQSKLRAELKINNEKKPYLKACVREAIRMMPVTAGNIRETTKEYSILGYKIPKGCYVIFAHMEMSRMNKYYVKAQEYIPERWLVDKDDPLCYKNSHPFAYGPFGFGARSCVGRRIAELEMETFIARAIENFDVEWSGPPPKIVQTSVNYVKGPYNYIFKDAK